MKGVAVAEHDEETLKEGMPLRGGFGAADAMRLHNGHTAPVCSAAAYCTRRRDAHRALP
ncbi:protein of unknown function [Paraburkholderia dioscoreae]|uniref:Uncharacterized protein n=1 Tax=Paraburkholderia dioscoreae TaxID=2604047 RepID=A0A5Q4Z8W2_9BURK|nr:protein of unknown function [Paraburkholderia dioscoreae]